MCISSFSSWISGPCEGQWSRGSHGAVRAELGSWGLSQNPARSRTPGTGAASGTFLRMGVGHGQARTWVCSGERESSPAMLFLGQKADGLEGLTWGPGPWISGGNREATRDLEPTGPHAARSGFLSCVFWKCIYFCQVPWYSGDMKRCRIQFLLHYACKNWTNTHQSFII